MEKRIVRSVAESLSRLNDTKAEVASHVDTTAVKTHAKKLVNPGSPSSALKKAGVALIVVTPDPVTAVPGVALIASSYAMRRKSPTKLDDVVTETKKILREFQSLSL